MPLLGLMLKEAGTTILPPRILHRLVDMTTGGIETNQIFGPVPKVPNTVAGPSEAQGFFVISGDVSKGLLSGKEGSGNYTIKL